MEHSYFKDRISAFHDRELKHEEEQMIAEHLESCAECRQLLEELRKFDNMVEKHSSLADDDYWEKSAQKIEAAIGGESVKTEVTEVVPSSWKGLGWKLAGVAASLAVIAFIALYEGEISDEVRKEVPALSKPAALATPPSDSMVDSNRVARESVQEPDDKDEFVRAGKTLDVTADEALSPAVETPVPARQPVTSDAEVGNSVAGPTGADDAELSEQRVVSAPVPEEEVAGVPKLSILKVDKGKTHIVAEAQPDTMDLGVEIAKKRESGRTKFRDRSSVIKNKEESAAVVSEEALPSESLDVDEAFRALLVELNTLRAWRAKRDSLEAVLVYLGDAGSSQMTRLEGKKKITAAATDQRELKEMVDSVSAEISWRDPQLQLLECHYEIARLTDDDDEYEASVQYLKDYLERENATFKLHAAWYLQQLEESE